MQTYPELKFLIVILGIITLFITVIVYFKRKDLKYYFLVYIISTIGTFIDAGTEIMDPGGIGNSFKDIFYFSGALILFVTIFKEYFDIFLKNNYSEAKLRSIGIFSIFSNLFIIFYVLEVITCIFLSICVIMLLKIYFKKKTITHAFISLSIFPVLLAGILNIFKQARYNNLEVYVVGLNMIFYTVVLTTVIVALLDQKLLVAKTEKLYMKDKYSHELGNIFHTISMAYELMTISNSKDSLQDEMDIIIKKKINEASELVKFIRNL